MEISRNLEKLFNIASKSNSHVLITGSTGTGKTTLARMIHQNGRRGMSPFVSINLATLHEGVLESELFGHEKGSFTGADCKRTGKLELAHGGTVFLDEIGELTPRLQARLLEFLQNKTISPLGSNKEVRLDVRVIAATHRDLASAVQKREFREDLFHRLRVISMELKSLCERLDELEGLVSKCLREICLLEGRPLLEVSSPVLEKLKAYRWPGNIRELRNILEYAVFSCGGNEIRLEDLPSWMEQAVNAAASCVPLLGVAEIPMTLDYQGSLEHFEKEYLRRALSRNGGRINRTARQIGINKSTLLRRVQAYGLSVSGQNQQF